MTRIVHRLKSHASTHGPITDHRNGIANPMVRRTAQITRHSKTKRRGNGG